MGEFEQGQDHLHEAAVESEILAQAGPCLSPSHEAKLSLGRAIDGVLAHRADAGDHLARALELDPSMSLALLIRAFALRVLGRRDTFDDIESLLSKVETIFEERGALDRERLVHRVLSSWMAGRPEVSVEMLEEYLESHHSDPLLAKFAHAISFMMGDSDKLLSVIDRVVKVFPKDAFGRGYMLGCFSFALEENRHYDLAKTAGEEALAKNGRDSWALHAVAHVHYERREFEAGLDLFERWPQEGLTNFAGHIAWHKALFLDEVGRTEETIPLYDNDIASYPERDYRDVSNSTSLLLILESAGIDVGNRWQEMADRAANHFGDHGSSFADVHYVLALAGAGRFDRATEFVESMRRVTQGDEGFDATVTTEVGAKLAQALLEARRGNGNEARLLIRELGSIVSRIGGSRAQRRVINWALKDVARDEELNVSKS